MKEADAKVWIKRITKKVLNNKDRAWRKHTIRFINIHGNAHTEAGLPDLIILINLDNKYAVRIWLELKRNLTTDEPKKLQIWNVEESLPTFGYHTGYSDGRHYANTWSNRKKKVELEQWIKDCIYEEIWKGV